MRPPALVALVVAALAVAGLLLLRGGGSGGDSEPRDGRSGRGPGGGTLILVAPAVGGALDPLAARTAVERAEVRQVYEPLGGRVEAPEGRPQRSRGLALAFRPSSDQRVWRLQLRGRVRFQDGAPFNAEAVRVNGQRWRTTGVGRRLLPGLRSVDAPRPSVVRMVFRSPQAALPERLADPRLGIVSPRALRPRSGRRARVRDRRSGSGPFEVRGWQRGVALELVRNTGWWGSERGLGPSLDGVRFRAVAAMEARARALDDGQVSLAAALAQPAVAELRRNPNLLVVAGRPGPFVAVTRALRGVDPARLGSQSFSGAWFTRAAP